jgi:integrase
LIAETLYVTGARVSEVLGVRRDQVKENGTVELRLYGKGGKERTSRIPAELYRRILAEFPEGTYLFESYKGQHFHREYISREIARAARRVLGRSVSAHVLRHSRATDLLAATHRIKAVSRLLGHSDEATTLHYYVRDAFSDEELFDGV